MHNQAVRITERGRFAEADKLARETLDTCRRKLGAKDSQTLLTTRLLALIVTSWSWKLATDADPSRHNLEKAVELGLEATQLQPDVPNHWSNLGVARYRAGQWQASVESLEKADLMIPTGDRVHRGERRRAFRICAAGVAAFAGVAVRPAVRRSRHFEGIAWPAEGPP